MKANYSSRSRPYMTLSNVTVIKYKIVECNIIVHDIYRGLLHRVNLSPLKRWLIGQIIVGWSGCQGGLDSYPIRVGLVALVVTGYC